MDYTTGATVTGAGGITCAGGFLLQGIQVGIHLEGAIPGINDRTGISCDLYIGSLKVVIKNPCCVLICYVLVISGCIHKKDSVYLHRDDGLRIQQDMI
jgi:hypothetical protein